MPTRQPRCAFESKEFLESSEGRSVRILSEYYEPGQRLARHSVWHTAVFFGSARILSREEARKALSELEGNDASEKELQHARRMVTMSRYYEDARELSRLVTEWSDTLDDSSRLVVCSGGGGGIMEAANRGASEAGGRTVAFNIQLPFEQHANLWAQEDLTFDFHYFFMRKFWFVYSAKAIVVFPGGFGTFDEMMESLTLIQTHRVEKSIPIVIYGSEYWNDVVNMEKMAMWGTISEEDLNLFHMSDSPKDAFDYIVGSLTWEG